MNSKNNETLVCALGGLGEVGKNMYVVMHEEELFIIDCGVMFPEDDLMGIDYVLADYNVLKTMQNKIKGLIIAHGHEDHIGGIPFLLQNINIPVIYTPNIAGKLIKNKLEERNIPCPKMVTVNEELNINTFRSMIQEFEEKYAQNREFVQSAVYTKALEIASSEYHSFMILYTILITIMDILTEIQSHIIKKDILNRRCVEYILSMYGIPFYRKIPEKFQERIAKNCHRLIKYKSSAEGMENIKDIFDNQSLKLYKYYIHKGISFTSYVLRAVLM